MNPKASEIKCLLLDIDGVMTNGAITYSANGDETKIYNVKDGFGLTLLKKEGFILGIITARYATPIIERRAVELKFDELIMGQRNKLEAYEQIKQKYQLEDRNIAYMGDDIIDLQVLMKCGYSGCPQDAHREVLLRSDFISTKNGGNGAVREFIEDILKARGLWDGILKSHLL